mgnify:CR=1 FL=1
MNEKKINKCKMCGIKIYSDENSDVCIECIDEDVVVRKVCMMCGYSFYTYDIYSELCNKCEYYIERKKVKR